MESFPGLSIYLNRISELSIKMSKEEEDKRNTNNPFQQPNRGYQGKEEEEEMRLFGVLMFGLIGATATTLAVSIFQFFKNI